MSRRWRPHDAPWPVRMGLRSREAWHEDCGKVPRGVTPLGREVPAPRARPRRRRPRREVNAVSSTIEKRIDQEGTCGRREEILEAATALFAEHGYSDTVTQVLAEKLQVGKGTI